MNFLNKILRWLVIGGLFLLPFLPLVVTSSMFFPFITGKNFVFRIIVEIIAAGWLALCLIDPAARPRRSLALWAVGAFIVIVSLATIFSVNPHHSFWSNYERMEGLITYWHLALYFLVASSVLSRRLWEKLWQTSLAVSVIIGGYGLLQLAGKLAIHQGAVRLDATLGNAAYLAVYALWHVFLALYFYWPAKRQTSGWRWYYLGVAALNGFILYHTATRGTILGLLGGLVVAAGLVAWRGRGASRRIALGAVAAVAAIVTLFFLVRGSAWIKDSPVLGRFATISLTERTTESRFLIWQMSWRGFKEHPLLGWGPENYTLIFDKYYQPKLWRQEPWFDRSHNVFLDWLTTTGALGLLAYLGMFGAVLWLIWRPTKTGLTDQADEDQIVPQSLLIGLVFGYFFHNLFVFDNLISYWLFFSFLAYLTVINQPTGQPTVKPSYYFTPLKGLAAGLVAIVTIFIVYQANVKPISASQNLIRAISPQADPVLEIGFFEKVFEKKTFGSGEAIEQFLIATLQVVSNQSVTKEVKQQFFQRAVNEVNALFADGRGTARQYLLYGSFLGRLGQFDEALKFLALAHDRSPRKQAVLFEVVNIYLSKGDLKSALEAARQALELAPDYDEARYIYALTALYAKQEKLTAEILKPIYPDAAPPDQRFVNAYAALKAYGKIVLIWQKLVAANPTNGQYRVSLAAAYLAIGERSEAINEIRQAIAIEPAFKDQGERLIKEIQAGRTTLE